MIKLTDAEVNRHFYPGFDGPGLYLSEIHDQSAATYELNQTKVSWRIPIKCQTVSSPVLDPPFQCCHRVIILAVQGITFRVNTVVIFRDLNGAAITAFATNKSGKEIFLAIHRRKVALLVQLATLTNVTVHQVIEAQELVVISIFTATAQCAREPCCRTTRCNCISGSKKDGVCALTKSGQKNQVPGRCTLQNLSQQQNRVRRTGNAYIGNVVINYRVCFHANSFTNRCRCPGLISCQNEMGNVSCLDTSFIQQARNYQRYTLHEPFVTDPALFPLIVDGRVFATIVVHKVRHIGFTAEILSNHVLGTYRNCCSSIAPKHFTARSTLATTVLRGQQQRIPVIRRRLQHGDQS